jgi:signal transduction histidine kinase
MRIMSKKDQSSDFLPAQRASRPEVGRLAVMVSSFECEAILDMLPLFVLVLNRERQILFANAAFADFAGKPAAELIGRRPGEALGCLHHAETEGGCGTTEYCRYCGAARAILASLEGRHEVLECRISRSHDDSLEAVNLQAFSYPFSYGGDEFIILAMVDIYSEKRLKLFERIFFHDVLDTSSGILGLCRLLDQEIDPLHKDDTERLLGASARLIDQIVAQQQLAAAEDREVMVTRVKLGTMLIVNEIVEFFRRQNLASGKILAVAQGSRDVFFESDKNLVYRVISNLVKNALEATEQGQTVTLDCGPDDGRVFIRVHNPAVMPEEVKRQVFKRFYSTKGEGRGLGTYGAKLLAKDYLDGELDFTSEPDQGTTFTLRLPAGAR